MTTLFKWAIFGVLLGMEVLPQAAWAGCPPTDQTQFTGLSQSNIPLCDTAAKAVQEANTLLLKRVTDLTAGQKSSYCTAESKALIGKKLHEIALYSKALEAVSQSVRTFSASSPLQRCGSVYVFSECERTSNPVVNSDCREPPPSNKSIDACTHDDGTVYLSQSCLVSGGCQASDDGITDLNAPQPLTKALVHEFGHSIMMRSTPAIPTVQDAQHVLMKAVVCITGKTYFGTIGPPPNDCHNVNGIDVQDFMSFTIPDGCMCKPGDKMKLIPCGGGATPAGLCKVCAPDPCYTCVGALCQKASDCR